MDYKGTEANLKKETRDNPYGASSSAAKVDGGGVSAPVSMTPVAPSSAWQSRGGTIEGMTTAASLNKTPQKGWNGAVGDMSKRAVKASK